ncbi:MAG TPA: acyl carrier protein [Actinobacteria bacterium]|jgi:acyl carrier protein|nr:acyl carrier protein [Actinomycetota bacterium]
MERQELETKVRSVLADKLALDEDRITLDARLSEDLDADSLDLVEVVMGLEDSLGISIPEEEIDGVKTVRQAVDLVEAKLAVAASA